MLAQGFVNKEYIVQGQAGTGKAQKDNNMGFVYKGLDNTCVRRHESTLYKNTTARADLRRKTIKKLSYRRFTLAISSKNTQMCFRTDYTSPPRLTPLKITR